jgi:hypothetical protein
LSEEDTVDPILAQTTVHVIEQNPHYFVGWGTLSLVNAGLAQSKNRSGLGWWFASIFLGPIATFILVAFCDKLPEPRRGAAG